MSKEYKFREDKPVRTCIKKYKQYSSYKKDLKKDFKSRCGYCNSHEEWHNSHFHIDHFAPKSKFAHLETVYSNLIYSCSYCNLAKSNKWISNDETINVIGNEGFVDPCNSNYDKLFKRTSKGVILPQTKLAEYIYKELKMGLKIHSIFWTIERISNSILELEKRKKRTIRQEQIYNQLLKIFYNLSADLRNL